MIYIGQSKQVEIKSLSSDGSGVGRIDGMAVFIAGGLPGEILRVMVTQVKKRYTRARLEEIISPSPHRVNPPCPYSRQCGGCAFMHLSYEAQLQYKQERLGQTLERLGGISGDCVRPIVPSEPLFYRNRVQLHADKGKCGFFAPFSYTLIPIKHCHLASPLINRIILALAETEVPQELSRIVIQVNPDDTQASILLEEKSLLRSFNLLINALVKNIPEFISVSVKSANATIPIKGPDLNCNLCGVSFALPAGCFMQVNAKQAESMYRLTLALADIKNTDVAADLFCGIGVSAIMLAERARLVLGVESYAPSAQAAAKNARFNKRENLIILEERAETALPRLLSQGRSPSVVLIDPPRGGLDPVLVKSLLRIKPRRIVYTSCDVATLARDLKLFKDEYAIDAAYPIDMFPQTPHVETIVLLQRRGT